MHTNLRHTYQTYIGTTPDVLWKAVTNPEETEKYFYGLRVESEFSPGSAITYWRERDGDRAPVISGEILACEPHRRLVHTFDHGNGDRPSRVAYEIEPLGEVVKLSIIHDDFDGETKTYETVGPGWNVPISGLKTLLETGKPLKIPVPASTEA